MSVESLLVCTGLLREYLKKRGLDKTYESFLQEEEAVALRHEKIECS